MCVGFSRRYVWDSVCLMQGFVLSYVRYLVHVRVCLFSELWAVCSLCYVQFAVTSLVASLLACLAWLGREGRIKGPREGLHKELYIYVYFSLTTRRQYIIVHPTLTTNACKISGDNPSQESLSLSICIHIYICTCIYDTCAWTLNQILKVHLRQH